MSQNADLLPGTLDLLILKAVSLGELHGYAVLQRIEQISGGSLQIQQGALKLSVFPMPRHVVGPAGRARPRAQKSCPRRFDMPVIRVNSES